MLVLSLRRTDPYEGAWSTTFNAWSESTLGVPIRSATSCRLLSSWIRTRSKLQPFRKRQFSQSANSVVTHIWLLGPPTNVSSKNRTELTTSESYKKINLWRRAQCRARRASPTNVSCAYIGAVIRRVPRSSYQSRIRSRVNRLRLFDCLINALIRSTWFVLTLIEYMSTFSRSKSEKAFVICSVYFLPCLYHTAFKLVESR